MNYIDIRRRFASQQRRLALQTDLGRVMRNQRRALGYTQADVAERAAVSLRTIGRVERGGDGASFQSIISIADVLCLRIVFMPRSHAVLRICMDAPEMPVVKLVVFPEVRARDLPPDARILEDF